MSIPALKISPDSHRPPYGRRTSGHATKMRVATPYRRFGCLGSGRCGLSLLIARSLLHEVVDDHEDRVTHCHRGALHPATPCDPVELFCSSRFSGRAADVHMSWAAARLY